MQPTYLPWSGYWNLMVTADTFVFLDDAQFQRTSWHCRNRIVVAGRAAFLTVPVCRTGLETRLCDARIDYSRDWRKSHEGQVRQAYARTRSGPLVLDLLRSAWMARPERLIDLNLRIIRDLAQLLGIQTPLWQSSQLGISGERSERLLKICRHFQAGDYLSPAGSAEYLEEDGFESDGETALHFQSFAPGAYSQPNVSEFIPYMSIVDVIANLGVDAAAAYVRQPSFPTFHRG
jgi:hypothetical protein